MNNKDQEFIVQKIRSQYTEKENSELDELKRLDAKVKRPANVFAYIFGSIGAIVMGAGMSLVMTDIGTTLNMENTMTTGIIIGIAGMLMAIINYPVYKKILNSRREKFSAQIVELSNRIINK